MNNNGQDSETVSGQNRYNILTCQSHTTGIPQRKYTLPASAFAGYVYASLITPILTRSVSIRVKGPTSWSAMLESLNMFFWNT